MTVRLTKTAATTEARRQLSYGWFQDAGSRAHVRCPRCRHKARVEYLPWASAGAVQQLLRVALVQHLMEEHRP